MRTIHLLDCTLRDGGYINDWNFGRDTLTAVSERLVSAGVDIIELGFLDERRPFDPDRSIQPDTASMAKVYGDIDKGNAMLVGMIDYGTCGIDCLQPCAESCLDGIRVIFKKHLMHEAIDFCRVVKEKGYQVFTQAVSITSYTDEELLELIGLVNDLSPFAVSMVDTYGLLQQDNLIHIFNLMDEHLLPGIRLGYHAHNNFQLGYANSVEIMNRPGDRPLLIDGTLYGMGKSAGNAPIELLAMYMNNTLGKSYDLNQLMEAIDANILDIHRQTPWGYNFFYYIAASMRCHPNYVAFLMDKRTLSVKSIREILEALPEEKKLLYDAKLAEERYLDYQKHACDDSKALEQLHALLGGKEVLVLGPSRSIGTQKAQIRSYIDSRKPIVLAINFIPRDFSEDIAYLFLTNSKRYAQMASALAKNTTLPVIATSNVTRTNGTFPFVLNYEAWIDRDTEIPDNSLIMLLKVLCAAGVRQAALAGFDGYSAQEVNYYNIDMEYSFAREKASYLNRYARTMIGQIRKDMAVEFVTASRYQNDEKTHDF